MRQESLSRWLKGILIGLAVCGVVVYVFVIPSCGKTLTEDYPEFEGRYWPWLIFLWLTGLPCFAALVLGWRIAESIGKDRSFSPENAKQLKRISRLAAADSFFFFAGNAAFLLLDMSHPGVMLGSMLVVFAGIAIAVAAAALSHLVLNAADLQEQSDLTI